MDPFLKWAGGKRWLARSEALPRPASYRRYIEPFLGSGAVFFDEQPREAILSDVNAELICLFLVMRNRPHQLKQAMREHQRLHSKAYYYQVRSCQPDAKLERAARTLYLNRTCWNGLYRVNLRGEFNVPIGTKSLVLDESEDFGAYSRTLRRAQIRCCDFEATISEAGRGDFVFVDPPYTARHNKNGFLKYNESIFSWDDQVRLHDSLVRATRRGAMIVVTNADHSSVAKLYTGSFEYAQLSRASVLAGNSAFRGATTEALFTANIRNAD